MNTIQQATQANAALTSKLNQGEEVTAEDYATVLNLNNQVLNETHNPASAMMATVTVLLTVEHIETTSRYTVGYNPDDDTFSVTVKEEQANG